MIEVTDEMVADGTAAWIDARGGSMREHLTAAYRAMRALEPPPHDRVERRPFAADEPVYGIPNNALGHRYEKNTRGPGQAFARGIMAADLQTRVFEAPLEANIDRAHRRIDALTALVLELGRRSFGYPPGDATLQRLIAELEPTS